MSKQIFQKFDVEFRKKVVVPTPEDDDEAVNKAYADSLVSVSDYRVRGGRKIEEYAKKVNWNININNYQIKNKNEEI